jgi:hypothetical protein
MSATVTMPPKNERMAKPEFATWTSGPNIKLNECDGDRQGQYRVQTERAQVPGAVTAHDDVLALAQVFHAHHAPDQCQAIGGEREDSADKKTVQQELDVEHRGQGQET